MSNQVKGRTDTTRPVTDSSNAIATTAFVQQLLSASTAAPPSVVNPLMNGVVSPGVSLSYTREDHIHPTDTSRAPLASPTFTGIPAAPTPVAGTNSTQIATTAFVRAGRVWVDAADYGLLPSNTGAQNVTAWGTLMAFATVTPCTIYIRRGTYDFNAGIAFNAQNTRISGDGIDVTILRCTFASGDFITQSGTIWYQTFDNLTITSSVTRTASAMFTSGFWKRGLMYRVKITQHFHGIFLPQFEVCTLAECVIATPSGAGTAVIIGQQAATNQGAGLNIFDCLIRGNDETNPASAAVGNHGFDIFDIEAVFCVNTDLGEFLSHAVSITPQTRVANCYFLQTFFDGTTNGFNLYIGGTGQKISLQFTGCWFNGAGNMGATLPNCYALALDAAGTYTDVLFSGCRFISSSSAGAFIVTPQIGINFSGCNFYNCGFHASSTVRDAFSIGPGSAASGTLNITGCTFASSGGVDIRLVNSNVSGKVNISGNTFASSLAWLDGTYWGNVSGNIDSIKTPLSIQVASASTIQISPCYGYVVVSGTTNINRIQPTYPGHIVSLRFLAALTVVDDGNNIRLAGNLVTAATTILTLVCEGNGDWREVSRVTS